MYNTSDKYKEKILADSTQQVLNIYIDGEQINPNHIFDFKMNLNLFNNSEFCLGATPEIDIEFKIHISSLPDEYNEVFVESGIEDEVIPIGYFTIQKPVDKENDTTATIKAIDYMKKFEDNNYDGSDLTYPATTLEVAKDICNKIGVELGSVSFLNDDKQIAVYDNTISARTYIGYIAEQAGGFAIIGRDGKLYIKTFQQDISNLNINLFREYTWGDKFKVSRVSYEDGIQTYKYGNETDNTVYIDANNMYIINEEQVQNIHNQINELELYPFEGETITDPAYDVGDIIIIDNKKVLYQGEIEYVGKFKASIKSKIEPKTQQESSQTKQSNFTKIRRVQSSINQITGEIEQLVQETSEHSEKMSQVEQDVDSINQKVSSLTDYTRTSEGINAIHLTETIEGKGYITNFTIKGDSDNFIYLTPSNSLVPSNNLVPLGRRFNIVCDKQNRSEISDEAVIEEIILEEPLRSYLGVYDELNIIKGVTTVTRRIGVNTDLSMYILENEIIENIGNCVLTTFKDDTYIYIKEYYNLEYSAKYIISEDFVTTEILNSAIDSNSQQIMLEVNKKVDEEEFGTKIIEDYKSIQIAWNQISQYLKIEGIEGEASLVIYNENNNMLMKLNQNGEAFYDESGNELGSIGVIKSDDNDILAFSMPVDWENVDTSRSMAWGIVDPKGTFLPIFHLAGYYGAENSEYGGELIVEGKLSAGELNIINNLNFEATAGIKWSENKYIMPAIIFSSENVNEWLTYKAPYGHDFFVGNTSVFSMNESNIYMKKPFFIPCSSDGTGYEGYPMIGTNLDYKYYCNTADGVNLGFFINNTYVATISDKRLKKDIKEIDDEFLDAINEIGIKQFKADNRNGQISFGIIAQELISVFKKYEIDPDDYEILQKIKYKLGDNTEYYRIEYTQFFALKQLANDRKIEELETKDKEKDELIQDLIKRIEILEGGINNG